MNGIDTYKIDLESLGDELRSFRYVLDDEFFRSVEGAEIAGGQVQADVEVERQGQNFKIRVSLSGFVTIPCDVCLDPMRQPINAKTMLVAKFGEAYLDDGEVITVDENEGTLDMSWLLYEQASLAIPPRHVHEPGSCNSDMLAMLAAHEQQEEVGGEENAHIDKRWKELEKLKTIFKD